MGVRKTFLKDYSFRPFFLDNYLIFLVNSAIYPARGRVTEGAELFYPADNFKLQGDSGFKILADFRKKAAGPIDLHEKRCVLLEVKNPFLKTISLITQYLLD